MFIINTKKVTLGGILTALTVAILYLASVMPTLRLTACAVSSAIICVMMIKYGTKSSLLVYLAASVVSFVLLPNKMLFVGYALFFGNYPIIKAYIERIGNIAFEWVVKLILFGVYSVIAYGVVTAFFSNVVLPYSNSVLLAVVIVIAAIYDIALSLFVSEIRRRFLKLL